jgi:pyruvate dehydrogenase E2 component (dihydrolipoamide acetyltransferase)
VATVVRMPSVLAGATEAAIANWLVQRGDTVAVGTPMAEIETEKALVEYAAEEAGVIGRLVVAVGDTAEIGDPIAVLVSADETDADIDAALAPASPAAGLAPREAVDSAAPAIAAPAPPAAAATRAMPETGPGPSASAENGNAVGSGRTDLRIFASPLVRKIAGEKGVDLGALAGTGPNGRIVRRDLERFIAAQPTTHAQPTARPVADATVQARPAPAAAPVGSERLIPHTPMRRAIARRLAESKATVPHFYLVADCVVDELLALRRQVNETSAVKISVNDFVLMAAAAAFRDVPEANVTWSDEGLIAHENVDISIAVATEGGLVTPVLRGVERLRLSGVARAAADLAQRGRDRRLRQDEIEGGTFAISNLGMYGTLEFAAIINPPQSGILAVGAAKQQPVVADGAVAVAAVMRCTLSVDHRAIDGALAARWLAAFTTRVENPLATII